MGAAPEARAYHTFSAHGACCYALAGRTHGNRLCKGKQMLHVYDCASSRWITPGAVVGAAGTDKWCADGLPAVVAA